MVVSHLTASDGVAGNIEINSRRGLPEFRPAICRNDGTFVIVGSGPSLAGFADEIKAEQDKGRPICAIKGAHDWLMDNGITPDLFFSIDPRDRRNNVQKKNEITHYILSSRCDPIMFDHLKDCNLMILHCLSSDAENKLLLDKGHDLVGGMSTSGLRVINVAYLSGFKKFIMFGMDSCNAADGVTKRIDGSLTGQTTEVTVGGPGGRKFICNLAMAKQAEDFQRIYQMMPDITVESRGDGLLTAIIAERKARGYHA